MRASQNPSSSSLTRSRSDAFPIPRSSRAATSSGLSSNSSSKSSIDRTSSRDRTSEYRSSRSPSRRASDQEGQRRRHSPSPLRRTYTDPGRPTTSSRPSSSASSSKTSSLPSNASRREPSRSPVRPSSDWRSSRLDTQRVVQASPTPYPSSRSQSLRIAILQSPSRSSQRATVSASTGSARSPRERRRSHSRERSTQDRGDLREDRQRERGSDRDRDRASYRDRESAIDRSRDRDWDRDRDRERGWDRDRGRDWDRDRERKRGLQRDRDRTTDRGRERSRERDKERTPKGNRERDSERDREWSRERNKGRSSERSSRDSAPSSSRSSTTKEQITDPRLREIARRSDDSGSSIPRSPESVRSSSARDALIAPIQGSPRKSPSIARQSNNTGVEKGKEASENSAQTPAAATPPAAASSSQTDFLASLGVTIPPRSSGKYDPTEVFKGSPAPSPVSPLPMITKDPFWFYHGEPIADWICRQFQPAWEAPGAVKRYTEAVRTRVPHKYLPAATKQQRLAHDIGKATADDLVALWGTKDAVHPLACYSEYESDFAGQNMDATGEAPPRGTAQPLKLPVVAALQSEPSQAESPHSDAMSPLSSPVPDKVEEAGADGSPAAKAPRNRAFALLQLAKAQLAPVAMDTNHAQEPSPTAAPSPKSKSVWGAAKRGKMVPLLASTSLKIKSSGGKEEEEGAAVEDEQPEPPVDATAAASLVAVVETPAKEESKGHSTTQLVAAEQPMPLAMKPPFAASPSAWQYETLPLASYQLTVAALPCWRLPTVLCRDRGRSIAVKPSWQHPPAFVGGHALWALEMPRHDEVFSVEFPDESDVEWKLFEPRSLFPLHMELTPAPIPGVKHQNIYHFLGCSTPPTLTMAPRPYVDFDAVFEVRVAIVSGIAWSSCLPTGEEGGKAPLTSTTLLDHLKLLVWTPTSWESPTAASEAAAPSSAEQPSKRQRVDANGGATPDWENGNYPYWLPGGYYCRELDGGDPLVHDEGLIQCGRRHVKETLGLDLTNCGKWRRLMRFVYRRTSEQLHITTVFYVDISPALLHIPERQMMQLLKDAPSPIDGLSVASAKTLKVPELRSALLARGMDVRGKRDTLVKHLQGALRSESLTFQWFQQSSMFSNGAGRQAFTSQFSHTLTCKLPTEVVLSQVDKAAAEATGAGGSGWTQGAPPPAIPSRVAPSFVSFTELLQPSAAAATEAEGSSGSGGTWREAEPQFDPTLHPLAAALQRLSECAWELRITASSLLWALQRRFSRDLLQGTIALCSHPQAIGDEEGAAEESQQHGSDGNGQLGAVDIATLHTSFRFLDESHDGKVPFSAIAMALRRGIPNVTAEEAETFTELWREITKGFVELQGKAVEATVGRDGSCPYESILTAALSDMAKP